MQHDQPFVPHEQPSVRTTIHLLERSRLFLIRTDTTNTQYQETDERQRHVLRAYRASRSENGHLGDVLDVDDGHAS